MGCPKRCSRSQGGGQPSWARAKLGLNMKAITPLWRPPLHSLHGHLSLDRFRRSIPQGL